MGQRSNKPPVRQVPTRRVSGGSNVPPPPSSRSRSTNVNVPPPRRDVFPYIMGGLIALIVVGLAVVVYLVTSSTGPSTGGTNNSVVPTAAANTPPRMPMAEFKQLYDSPNQPLIIDVRAKDAYDQGHIIGAISFPESDVDTRVNELPKDRLIVAYCS